MFTAVDGGIDRLPCIDLIFDVSDLRSRNKNGSEKEKRRNGERTKNIAAAHLNRSAEVNRRRDVARGGGGGGSDAGQTRAR